MAKGSSISKSAMWVLMGLLILGLAGFGATNLGGNIRSIGTVGDKSISVDQYARQVQNEIRAIEQQTRQPMPFARAQEIGLDRAVLQRIVRNRALDHENTQLGLSVGDETLRDEILNISAFQGVNGEFDREGYRQSLRQGGISEAEFETSLREEAARTLLQGAIVSGIQMPTSYAETLVNYVGEQRSFTWSELTEDTLTTPLAAASDADLQAFYDANMDRFMLDQTKMITYVVLSPDAMIDQVDVPEDELRAAYNDRINEYNQPERRLVERLVFGDTETADQAAANLEVSGTTFEALVEERGLDLADVDLGDVGRLELGAAGEQIFAAEVGDVVGPLDSALGPALFRVNGVLPAQSVTFETAEPGLRAELAVTRAQRAVEARAQDIDDQLAGGATLEQLAEETEMTLGTLAWTPESSESLAAYGDFREAAATLTESDFPRIQQLEDGSIYAMRLNETLPERANPFEAALPDVREAVRANRLVEALTAQSAFVISTLGEDASFEQAGLIAIVEENQTRNAFINGTPAGFMSEVFEMEVGDITVLPNEETVVIVRLDAVTPASQDAQSAALLEQFGAQINQTLAADVFNVFADEVVGRAGTQIDPRALQAVHVNFP
jgi:peptidyl-prolyl cis-trans isomerase D